MTLRKCIDLTSLLDGETSRSIATLQILETIDRNTGSSCGKLKETTLLFSVPCADNFPEVLNDLVLFLIATIVGVFLPVVDIDISNTANKQFKLTFIENVNKVSRDQFIETGDESVELLFDSFLNFPFCDKPAKS
jgi:hypothetical protein